MPGFLPPLSLYVHLPWCVRKCPYCDFNSHAVRDTVPEREYVAAVLRDLETEVPAASGRTIETIFLGGGTPSLFSPEAIAQLLAGIRERVALAPQAEITLEANPGTVDVTRFEGFRAAGVNRLSLGIQSFDDEKLRALGRIHGRAEALAAVEAAQVSGFDNLNLDLMFGLPGQSLAAALADVELALGFSPPHLSVYQLTLEPNTLFHARPPRLPEDDTIAAMQEEIEARLAAAGYQHYEVSAYARPGSECRHNLNYWRFGDYFGIGAGAHGKITSAGGIKRRWKVKHPDEYLARAGTPGAIAGEEQLTADDIAFEFLMNALRLRAGFDNVLFEARTGLPLSALAAPLAQARARGWLEMDYERIRASESGWRFLNDLLLLFVPARPGTRAGGSG